MLRPIGYVLVLAMAAVRCAAQEPHSHAATAKDFEIGGHVEARFRHYDLSGDGAAYQVRFADQPRNSLERSTALVRFRGSVRDGAWSVRFQTVSELEHTEVSHDAVNRFDELFASWRPRQDLSLDVGKIALKWGQAHSWNPVAFVERPKDPNDPRQAREGYVLLAASSSRDFSGALQSVKFTPVLLPVTDQVNKEFGKPNHLNLAGRLQFDFRDTDVDLLFLSKGSRARRFGFDFSHHAGENVELYGEWARVTAQEFRLVTTAGTRYSRTEAATSYVIGLRYRPQPRTQVVAELHHNGLGLTASEFRDFGMLAQNAVQAGPDSTLLARARSAADGQYGRSKPMQDYLYVRASRALIPFSPSIRATINLQVRSFSVAPELAYSGYRHWGIRLRYTLTEGGSGAEYGEKYYSRILDVLAHYHF